MNEKDIARYLEIKAQILQLQEELDRIKPELVVFVRESGGQMKYGDFIFRSHVSRIWSFSEEIQLLQETLRHKKKEEIITGVARLEKETPYVLVTHKKKPWQ